MKLRTNLNKLVATKKVAMKNNKKFLITENVNLKPLEKEPMKKLEKNVLEDLDSDDSLNIQRRRA